MIKTSFKWLAFWKLFDNCENYNLLKISLIFNYIVPELILNVYFVFTEYLYTDVQFWPQVMSGGLDGDHCNKDIN